MRFRFLLVFFGVICAISCVQRDARTVLAENPHRETHEPAGQEMPAELWTPPAEGPTAARLEQMGLVDVARLDPTIKIDMVYATPGNFVGEVLYEDLRQAYLQPDVAEKLVKAQKTLKYLQPELSLLVYDAARPMSAQRRMWRLVAGTPQHIYVANPNKGGGLHNYGAAVDVTLVDPDGNPLSMGTPFDFFGPEAHTDKETELVSAGKITRQELDNRLLLRRVMREAGFSTIRSEWWHFNALPLAEAKEKYPVIE